MVGKKLIYQRYGPPEQGKRCKKSSWRLFQLQISFRSWNPCNIWLSGDVNMTRIWLAEDVNDQNWAFQKRQYDQNLAVQKRQYDQNLDVYRSQYDQNLDVYRRQYDQNYCVGSVFKEIRAWFRKKFISLLIISSIWWLKTCSMFQLSHPFRSKCQHVSILV